MTGRLRQLSEPRLRQQAWIGKSQTPVERDSLVQWVRKNYNMAFFSLLSLSTFDHDQSQIQPLRLIMGSGIDKNIHLLYQMITYCAIMLNTIIPKPTSWKFLLHYNCSSSKECLPHPNYTPSCVIQWEGIIQYITTFYLHKSVDGKGHVVKSGIENKASRHISPDKCPTLISASSFFFWK